MTCDDVKKHLSAYLDKELSGDLEEIINGHLAQCPACMAEKVRLAGTISLVQNMDLPLLKTDLSALVMASINRKEAVQSYYVFNAMLGIFAVLTAGIAALVSLSPLGQALLGLIRAFFRNIFEVTMLMVRVSARSPMGSQDWSITLALFLGFIFTFWILRKILKDSNLGGPLHE